MSAIWDPFVGFLRTALTSIADAVSFLGPHRWAAAIVLLTLAVRTLLLPLSIKQIRSMRETQRLQPEMARLRQKYKSDRQRLMQEMQELYQREGVNPYASCLPMLLQMPILFGMFSVIRSLDPRGGMPFIGLGDLSDKTSGSIGGWLLILVMTAVSLVQTRQLNPGQTDQQRRMQMLMPLMFVFFFISVPAALVLYYTTQTLYQFIQQLVMTRDMRKPGSGWRGILGLVPAEAPKGKGKLNGKAPGKLAGKAPGKQAPKAVRDEDPLVRTPVAAPAISADPLAARRSLEEKRQRRRRKKKKRKR